MSSKKLAICLGRFQPVHLGHIDYVKESLQVGDETLVIIGSAFQARTPRNPFTWQERAEMLRLAIPPELTARTHFVPLRDYYDSQRWIEQLSSTVQQFTQQPSIGEFSEVCLVGDFSDATISCPAYVAGWKRLPRRRMGQLSSTLLRDWLFSSNLPSSVEYFLRLDQEHQPATWLHPTTTTTLNQWRQQPTFEELSAEWLNLFNYKKSWLAAPYSPVMVTSDVVLRCRESILLIERRQRPGQGLLALPGGFIESQETVFQSALRELAEETAIELSTEQLRQFLKASAVFDHPNRSQRGRVITHAFYFDLGDREFPSVTAGDDAGATNWTAIRQIASLEERFHDDHFFILDKFLGILNAVR